MNTKLGHLVGVEMRRALHRRLVRWMIALALLLCAFSGVVIYLSSGRPRRTGTHDGSSRAHGDVVEHQRRERRLAAAHGGRVPRHRRRDLRRLSGRRRMARRHDHHHADLGTVAPTPPRCPHRCQPASSPSSSGSPSRSPSSPRRFPPHSCMAPPTEPTAPGGSGWSRRWPASPSSPHWSLWSRSVSPPSAATPAPR